MRATGMDAGFGLPDGSARKGGAVAGSALTRLVGAAGKSAPAVRGAAAAQRGRNCLVSMPCFSSSLPSWRRSVPDRRAAALMLPLACSIRRVR